MPDNPVSHHVLLGFDFGMKRIGVAVGQTITHSAQALTILAARDGIPDWSQVLQLVTSWRADGLVVGIPFNMDGTEQHTTHAARKFAQRLATHTALPIYTVDERLTTVTAKALLSEHTQRKPPAEIDSYAAKLILESWLRQYSR